MAMVIEEEAIRDFLWEARNLANRNRNYALKNNKNDKLDCWEIIHKFARIIFGEKNYTYDPINDEYFAISFGRLALKYTADNPWSIQITMMTDFTQYEVLGTVQFSEESFNHTMWAMGDPVEYSKETGLEALMIAGAMCAIIQSMNVLNEYCLPSGCWVPSVEPDALKWVENYGMPKPQVVKFNKEFVTKRDLIISPMKLTSDDTAV